MLMGLKLYLVSLQTASASRPHPPCDRPCSPLSPRCWQVAPRHCRGIVAVCFPSAFDTIWVLVTRKVFCIFQHLQMSHDFLTLLLFPAHLSPTGMGGHLWSCSSRFLLMNLYLIAELQ